jgi:hypothetical protein
MVGRVHCFVQKCLCRNRSIDIEVIFDCFGDGYWDSVDLFWLEDNLLGGGDGLFGQAVAETLDDLDIADRTVFGKRHAQDNCSLYVLVSGRVGVLSTRF